MTRQEAARVERLRALCLSFPEAVEKRSHGEPTWFAGTGKVFAMLDDHHHGAPHLGVWLPQPPGVQHALLDTGDARFFKPPYVGVKGWVGVTLEAPVDWDLVHRLVREAYVHVAGARRVKALLARG